MVVGGAPIFFASVTSSEALREKFCQQVFDLCQSYQLKSVDLDWEYPDTEQQVDDYIRMVKDLHRLLNPQGIGITIAVGHWEKQAKLVAQMEPYLAGVNLMTYDNVSPSKGHASYDLVKRSVKRFIKHGIPPEKNTGRCSFLWSSSYSSTEKQWLIAKYPGFWDSISDKGEYEGYYFFITAKP